MRILVLSVLYPKSYNAMSGVFAHQQIKHIVQEGAEVRVVTGIPWAPRPLWFKPKWRTYGESPYERVLDAVRVNYPRYVEMPGAMNFSWSGVALYHGIKNIVRHIYKDFPFDLIHANTIIPDGYAGVKLSKQYNVPCLCVSRGDLNIYPHYGPMSMKATQAVLRQCNKLVTVSKDLAKVAMTLESKTPSNISVVYNGCDFERFNVVDDIEKKTLRNRLGLPQDKIILFLLGALEENKGIFELLDMYSILRESWGDKIHLVMIGSGKDEIEFKNRITKKGMDSIVQLAGSVAHDQVPLWIKAGDIMLFPTHYEGVPNAVLETMACAKPVVATDVGGIPEVIEHGSTGFLVKKRDVQGMVEAANALIENEQLRNEIGINAMQFIYSHASWPGNAKKMVSIYEKTITSFKN